MITVYDTIRYDGVRPKRL